MGVGGGREGPRHPAVTEQEARVLVVILFVLGIWSAVMIALVLNWIR